MTQHIDTATEPVETGALVIDGPQPVWMTLNAAREQAFTGELVFEADPEVLAYLDNGIVYYAERVADDPLGQRLLDAGVVDATQLERGLVRIGDLEHLGRLFDRDASINRDAVIVTAELFTEELISELANCTVANVRVAPYRHHPSGVHRWFVVPVEQTVAPRPIGAIGQLDGAVLGDLPGLPYNLDDDELMIEWDAMVDSDLDTEFDIDEFADSAEMDAVEPIEIVTPEQFDADALELSLELAEFVDDAAEQIDPPDADLVDVDFGDSDAIDGSVDDPMDDWIDASIDSDPEEFAVPALELPDLDLDADLADADVALIDDDVALIDDDDAAAVVDAGDDDFEFSVVWPDGSEQVAAGASVDSDFDSDEAVDIEPAFTETDDGELQFSMPPLELSDEPEAADADVPDDVADAVRRAIAAIESASVGDEAADVEAAEVEAADIEVADIDIAGDDLVDVADVTEKIEAIDEIEAIDADVDVERGDEAVEAPAASTNGFAGFAPPTMATRAEVLYGQMSDGGATLDDPALVPTLAAQPAMATGGDHGDGHDGERTSALRRLIGSLRRKDH